MNIIFNRKVTETVSSYTDRHFWLCKLTGLFEKNKKNKENRE